MTLHRDRVGRHAILDRLDGPAGRDLYLAEDARGERPLVVWLRRGLDAAAADEWLQAASRAALVRHPVLVEIVDSGRHGDGAFVAFERSAGRTLRDTLTHREAWPLRSRAQCAEQLCEAIAAVHRAGLVHGDISPATVYVEAADRVRLAPPGLADPADIAGVEASAETLRYCCPEELDGHPRDRRSDVYLLGAVVYLLVAGRDAFAGASLDAVRAEVLDGTPPSLGTVDAGMAALDDVLRRAMAKAPEARYPDADALAADLVPALKPLQAPVSQQSSADLVLGAPRAPDDGRPAHEPPPRSPTALAVDENVQFTVYRPRVLDPGRWHPMLVFAHLAERRDDAAPDEPDPVAEVASQAAALLRDVEGYRQHTEDSGQAVPREGELTFVPVADGVEFNPRSRSFIWAESVHRGVPDAGHARDRRAHCPRPGDRLSRLHRPRRDRDEPARRRPGRCGRRASGRRADRRRGATVPADFRVVLTQGCGHRRGVLDLCPRGGGPVSPRRHGPAQRRALAAGARAVNPGGRRLPAVLVMARLGVPLRTAGMGVRAVAQAPAFRAAGLLGRAAAGTRQRAARRAQAAALRARQARARAGRSTRTAATGRESGPA